jgi:uncharacterized protein
VNSHDRGAQFVLKAVTIYKGRIMSIHPDWLDSIHDPATYPHPVSEIQLLETHISWVVLTGDWAYKLKKPVDFGFVNFTTLELRRAACVEEVRLNRRTAPALYDGVVPLAMDVDGPQFGGSGAVIEYAVRMKQFKQDGLLERCLARGELTVSIIDQLAHEIAELHRTAAVAESDKDFGEPSLIRDAVEACVASLQKAPLSEQSQQDLTSVTNWIRTECDRLNPTFIARKQKGWVRECHGDLHLGNLVLYRGAPTIFDCLEFNPQLRWIDVFSDIAFLVMDLQDHNAASLASRVLNEWLERIGDYEGLQLLQFYLTYRALVRAKVAALRLQQCDASSPDEATQRGLLEGYVSLLRELIRPSPRAIVLMHGVSGSGKSFIAGALENSLPAIRIRSDVERKRLFGQWPMTANDSDSSELYSADATRQTYERLQVLARSIVKAGYSVVVDAAFLRRNDREQFRAIAEELRVPCVTVDCRAPVEILKQRIAQRRVSGADASDADAVVLQSQLDGLEPLAPLEERSAVHLETSTIDLDSVLETVRERTRMVAR